MKLIKLSESTAARKKIAFTTVSISNLQTRLDPDTLTFTTRVIKPDGTSASGGGSITHPDDTNALGVCYYECGSGDIDTLGECVLRVSGTGSTNMEPREIPYDVVAWDPYTDIAATVLAGQLETGVTVKQGLQIIGATTSGKLSGGGTGTEVMKGLDGSTTRATSTNDSDGNRTDMVYNV